MMWFIFRYIFWSETNGTHHLIKKSYLSGSNVATVVESPAADATSAQHQPFALDVKHELLYFIHNQ